MGIWLTVGKTKVRPVGILTYSKIMRDIEPTVA